jgi:HPt (histidine-containing phosphotransfer) domain-containing protein
MAQVFTDDKLHQSSLEKRLKKLGFLIEDDHGEREVDLCFIAKKEHHEITSIAEKQSPDTLILLMSNQQYYLNQNYYQLSFPLRHNELCKVIADHFSPKVFDHDLALKRADNRPELMRELLAILLESLIEDMQNLETALSQSDLTSMKELLHKIDGALRYSGTAKLSHSVKNFSDIAKKVSSSNTSFNTDLLKKAFSEVKKDMSELEQWYKEY